MDAELYGHYTVREAAIRLGISEQAVRQRIRRHTLVAERSEGIVYVVLPADSTADTTPAETLSYTADATPDSTAVVLAARAQLEAVRDEWLQPLVDQLAAAHERIGRLEAERDALQARVAAQERHDDVAVAEAGHTLPEPRRRAWWRFWRAET